MKSSERKISFLVTKRELKLLEETCLYGADADANLETAVPEKDQYRLTFSYEELDDLAGFAAACANHETSRRKRDQFDELCDKINSFLKLSDSLRGRSLEDLIKPKRPALNYFIFDVWLEREKGEKILRRIQIAESKSLYNFAKVITQAFGFYFDHCFGFYDNLQRYHNSQKAYELFVDIGEEPLRPGTKGVKKTRIIQAFKTPGDKMLFLFDYGDGWYFTVELKEIRQAEKWDLKPKILESIGKAPVQYPPCEDSFPSLT